MNLDLDPIKLFFTEYINPKDFAELLDEFLYDYTTMLIKIQLSDIEDKDIHESADKFIRYTKLLRDILPDCEQDGSGK
jgi:hypothetical protein